MTIDLVIKIPEEVKQAFDCAENNDLKCGYYDQGGVIGNAIKNGTPIEQYEYRQKMFSYLDGVADGLTESIRDTTDVLVKISTEIEETYMNLTYQENKDRKATWGLRKALQIIDKYRESEG